MKRVAIAGTFLAILGLISFFIIQDKMDTSLGLSFETFFRVIGQPIKTVDRSITRVIGVSAKNERDLGDYLAIGIEKNQVQGMEKEKAYVNNVIKELEKQYNPKELNYRVMIFQGPPNAFALPGGIIVITTGMLQLLKTEAQLVAILGHEKGHIDLGHCIDHMRFAAKTYQSGLGSFMDWYLSLMLNHTFSKFQENEADRFGYETLIALKYNPSALGEGFQLMLSQYPEDKQASSNIIQNYLTTHPSLSIRSQTWIEKAKRWKLQHPEEKYYIGEQNYLSKEARSQLVLPNEWQ